MKFNAILSAMVAATMFGASISPAMADDDHGRGKKKGHYKNGKAYGTHQSQTRQRNNDDWRKDDWRRDDDRRDAERWRQERERQERLRQAEQKRSREAWYRQQERERSNSSYGNSNYGKTDLDRQSDRRQQTKNEWRNIAYLSGGVALLGLLKKDNRLVFAGAAGALYSLNRYEQDRKSQASIDRARASYFSRSYFVRDGQRYDRRLVTKNGDRYYQFVRQ